MREARDERSFSKAQKASPLLFSFALCPGCHSRRFVKQHTLPPVSHFLLWAANPNWCSCSTPHACLFPSRPSLPPFFFFYPLTHVCRLPTSLSHGYPVSLLISRDVRRDERRRKISEMSSLMSNTKCEPSLFLTPPPPLSCLAAVTLAVLLGATPCQVEFRDSDTVSSNPSSGLSVSPGEKNGEGDGRKRRERQAERREATDRENLGARSKEDFAFCSTVTRVWLEFKVWLYKTERLNPRRDPNTPLALTTYGAFKRKVNYSRA